MAECQEVEHLTAAGQNRLLTSRSMMLHSQRLGALMTDPAAIFSDVITKAADNAIPKTSSNPSKSFIPWNNPACKKAVLERKKTERYFNRFPTAENLDKVCVLRAKARRIIKENRRSSWRSFVSGLTSRTPKKKVWNIVHSLKGKGNFSSVKHLFSGGKLITTKEDIANE